MSAVTDLEKGLIKLSDISYDSVDKLMRKIAKDNDISATELHHKFKAKHKIIPDDWAKKQMQEGWSDKYKKSINCDDPKGFSQRAHCQGRKKKMKEAKDHEVSMAQSQLDKTIANAKKLKKKLGTKEKDIPAWIQAKVTDTDHNMDAAVSYSEGNLHKWFKNSKSKDGKSGWVNVVTGGTCASDEPGEGTPKCVSSSKRASMTKAERLSAQRRKKTADPNQQQKSGAAKPTYVPTDKPKTKMKEETFSEEDKKGTGSGKKDACYHKVKASAKVWPSAYASGRLVQCRKKGAANYGNSKNEEFLALPEFSELQIKAMETAGYEVEVLDEKCWVGYTQKGMKKKGNRMVPNCVPVGETKNENVELKDAEGKKFAEVIDVITNEDLGITMHEATQLPSQNGNIYLVSFIWKGRFMMMKIFFPEVKRPSREQVQQTMNTIYPGCKVQRFDEVPYQPGTTMVMRTEEKTPAWQRKEGKNPSGGLNEKGRKSYERENPGSDLKAPQPEGGPRKRSFCARMGGMKGPMKDEKGRPTRKALALRKWKC
jgi:hypothetical protein